ncbi:hypothetical protein GF361_01270 [Candidatus Woesearchaeota archaeon]|nr:hypothetical protein [Candidatus Woesearchaeota archaeon]
MNMEAAETINKFKEFFEKEYEAKLKDSVRKGKHYLVIDFSELLNFDHELSDGLLDNPEDSVAAAEEAVKDCIDGNIKKFNIRFLNLPENQKVLVRNIRSKHIGRLLVMDGVVRQKSDVRPQVTSAKFECPSCGNIINVLQLDKTFKEPNKCGCGRKGKFRLLKKELVDAQGLVLEEDPENLEGGEQPKRMNVLLQDDLVSPLSERKTNPGSKIKIIGTIKEVPIFSRTGSQTTRFDLLIEANNFETIEENFYEVEITKEEHEEIKKLSKDPKIYKKLVQSIAPSIYGYKKVKEALILQLMGGVHKQRHDGVVTRGDMHILLIGDPGSGKSQLLKRVNLIAPKGRYVSGKGVSGAGLTASVVKDEFLKGWSLEAGALVLANNGMCCLHPDTSIVINNKIQKISKIFDCHKKELGKCKNEIVEFNDIEKDVVSFDIKRMDCEKQVSTVIRRKKFDGHLLNVKFKSGFSIKLTPDHKIIDGNHLGWKEAQEFKKGEKTLAPLNLPSIKEDTFIFDILPKNWKVFLNKKEKNQLKQNIRRKFKTLSAFNKKFNLDKNFLSGRKQITIKKFEKILEFLGEKNKWRKIPLKFGRNKNGEKLKIAKITPELGYILGFILGDGYINMNKRRTTINITQSIKNKENIKRIKEYWNKISLKKLKETEDNRTSKIRDQKVISKCKVLYSGSNLLGGLYKHYTSNALAEILSLPDDVLKGFIGGIMDSDGCISTRKYIKNGNKYFTQIIEFLFSNERKENLNFMLALRRFDCYGKINERENIKSVTISSRKDISNLIKELDSFSIKISKSRLLVKNKQISGDSDKIPSIIGKKICDRIIKLNKSFLLKKGIWSTVYGFKHGGREPSRNQIIKIINKTQDMINDKKFVEGSLGLIKRDYFLDEIVDIKKEKYSGYVYDLFVPKNHNFLADGIIVHNCIDEMDKMSQEDRSAMHEALEQQSFHYDTWISLADGSEKKIGNFVEKLMKKNHKKIIKGKDCYILPTEDKDVEIFTTDWNNIYKTKINRVSKHIAPDYFIKIKLKNGREITVTPEHPVFYIDECKIKTVDAENVKEDMWMPVPLETNIEGESQKFEITKEECYINRASRHIAVPMENGENFFKIIGYMLAEGSKELNRGKLIGINFTNKDERLLEDFENSMEELFGLRPYKQPRIDGYDLRYMYRYISRELSVFIERTCPEILNKSSEKEIPKICLKGKKEDVALMLSCMFEGDGHVSKKLRTIRVGFGSNSKKMCEQVQDLLLRFGIRSNLTEHKKSYKVSITRRENLLKFYEKIGFITKEKNNIIKKYLDNVKLKRSIKNNIPNVSKKVIKLMKKYGVKCVGNNCLATMKYDYLKRRRNISKQALQEIVKKISPKPEDKKAHNFLKKMAFGNIGFEKIKSIERIENKDQKWTYDVTIEPTHNFISQNMVLHNTISISKANIQATLVARTTVLAAANPKFGRFDPYDILAKQIDLPPALINRFDLIFPIKDMPDKEKDKKMAHHILDLHQNPDVDDPEIETELLKKYFAYARQNVNPKLTSGALEEIKNYYVEMRNKEVGEEGSARAIPISPRQLEALIRLSEASARTRLSPKVTKKDAKKAISLLHHCLSEIGVDPETGKIDIDRITTGITASQRNKIVVIKEIINELENKIGKTIPLDDLIKEAEDKGIEDIDDAIEKLKRSGDIFEPKRGFIQKI